MFWQPVRLLCCMFLYKMNKIFIVCVKNKTHRFKYRPIYWLFWHIYNLTSLLEILFCLKFLGILFYHHFIEFFPNWRQQLSSEVFYPHQTFTYCVPNHWTQLLYVIFSYLFYYLYVVMEYRNVELKVNLCNISGIFTIFPEA